MVVNFKFVQILVFKYKSTRSIPWSSRDANSSEVTTFSFIIQWAELFLNMR